MRRPRMRVNDLRDIHHNAELQLCSRRLHAVSVAASLAEIVVAHARHRRRTEGYRRYECQIDRDNNGGALEIAHVVIQFNGAD